MSRCRLLGVTLVVLFLGGTRDAGLRGRVGSAVAATAPSATKAKAKAPTVSEWARQLSDPDKAVRREAAYQLSRMGMEARAALPELIKALEDREQQVWFGAVVALAQIGPEAHEAVPVLMKGLERREQREGRQVWYRSSYALGRIGAAAVPALTEGLKDSESLVRAGCAQALGWVGAAAKPAVPALIESLTDSDADVRTLAGAALAAMGQSALLPLLERVSDERARMREEAARHLGRLPRPSAEAVRALLERLSKETDPGARAQQIACLSAWQAQEPEWLEQLRRALLDEAAAVRHAAINAWVSLPSAPEGVWQAMLPLLASDEPLQRERAALVVERLGEVNPAVAAALIKEARRVGQARSPFAKALAAAGEPVLPPILAAIDQEPAESLSEKHWAVACLRDLGPIVVPALSTALSRPHESSRIAVLEALRLMGNDASAAMEAMRPLVSADSAAVRSRALVGVLAVRSPTPEMVPLVERALRDADATVRRTAAEAVPRLGAVGESCIDPLVQALRDEQAEVRLSAARALATFGDKAKPAVPVLRTLWPESDATFRVAILQTLGSIGPAAAAATPQLVQAIQSDGAEARLEALRAVGRIGPGAVEARGVVRALLGHADASVRAAALAAAVRLEEQTDEALSLLGTGLDDEAVGVRVTAAEALGRFKEKGQPHAPRLFALLKQREERSAALDSLRQIKSTSVPHYIEALENEEPSVRVFACEALSKLGAAAKEATPALRQALKDSYDAVRRQARAALKSIEGKDP